MPPSEEQQQFMFSSNVERDIVRSIPKDLRQSPGPGTYDTEIQDKLKQLSFHLSSRYQMKPFGSGTSRFDYLAPDTNRTSPIDFNQTISVKDQLVHSKRLAFLQTIQMHKEQSRKIPNAVFSSTSERFQESLGERKTSWQQYNSLLDSRKLGGSPGNSMYDTTGTTLNQRGKDLNRTFQSKFNTSGDSINLSKKKSGEFNPNLGFNSTSQRFQYFKETEQMEQPGPGSYEPENLFTIAANVMPAKQGLMNTISSVGLASRAEAQAKVKARLNATTLGTSIFKDQTSREDFKFYIPMNSNNPNALKNLGPGSYFKDRSPFLKRSYNASLPASKFY